MRLLFKLCNSCKREADFAAAQGRCDWLVLMNCQCIFLPEAVE